MSQTVRRLESRLGLRPLTSTTCNVAPTVAGEQLLETVRPALADIDARIETLANLRASPAGTIRLTASRHATDRAERMFDRFPADVQDAGPGDKPFRHALEHRLVLPAVDAAPAAKMR